MQDPICGVEANGKGRHSSSYQGKDYFFSNKDCKAAFDRDPARYTSSGWKPDPTKCEYCDIESTKPLK